MKLFFLRHGKTEWNLESRYQGAGGDSPLLPESYEEIKQAASYLKQFKFAHIYASPIKRARETARNVRKNLPGKPAISLLSRLEEFHLGKMEGMLFKEAAEKFPQEFDAFRNRPAEYQPVEIGGESFQQLIDRMTPAIQVIVHAHPGDQQNVLVVSHGAALNAEINALLGTSLAHLRDRGGLSNTSTTILETKDGGQSFQLVVWNKTDYLKRKLDPTDTI
ncbi:histidine phosphatase family protein [Secundilactobacillus folii]|uniref:Histidine phosphatase family protein n=1 Tax=Secundilactobacillus folii TaxID=2678357 RepID=A0A7X2XWH7_9LACO|nr:histidine phosphatase family protein [Secundilactobacillus folii]MTV82899.1 histidine phosphatase family protein [Secundilactobacillus folii]